MNNKALWIGGGIVAVGGLGIGGYFILKKRKQNKGSTVYGWSGESDNWVYM